MTIYAPPTGITSCSARPAACCCARGAARGGGTPPAPTAPPRHKQLRSLVAAWFSQRSVRDLEQLIRSAVRATLATAAELGGCDGVIDMAGRLSSHVICAMLGVPTAHHER